MNTQALERAIIAASLDGETAAAIANCNICLLAPAMRDCPRCKFNVGLATSLFAGRAYDRHAEDYSTSDCHKIMQAMIEPGPADDVDFTEVTDRLSEIEQQAKEAAHPFWLDEPDTIGDAQAALFGDGGEISQATAEAIRSERGLQVIVTKSFADRWTNNPDHYRDYYHTDNIQID